MWILSSLSSYCSSPEHSLSFKLIRIPVGGDRKDRRVRVEERSVCDIGHERSCSNEVNGRIEEVRCPVCSRNFRSKKAMHGHMRCHPQRRWRGVNPPPPLPSAKKTASSDDYASLPSISSMPCIVVSSDHASLPPKKRRYPYALSDPPPPSTAKKTASSSDDGASLPSNLSLTSTVVSSDDASLPLKKRRYQYTVQKTYECRTCGKSFPTGQTLGGHQTCHRQQPKPPLISLLRNDQEAIHNPNPRGVLDFDLNQFPPMNEE